MSNPDVNAILNSPAMKGKLEGMQQALILAQLYQTSDLKSWRVTGSTADVCHWFNRLKNAGCLPFGPPVMTEAFEWEIFYFGEYDGK